MNPGESWAWQIGLVTVDHVVEELPTTGGRRSRSRSTRPARSSRRSARSYGLVVGGLIDRLARTAEATHAAGG